jgi:FxsC-like protein
MTHRFFMSYARADDEHGDERLVQRFFRDLSNEIAAGVPEEPVAEVGFLDQYNLEIGDQWPEELAEALSTCQTFVAVMTARFFQRPFCGKEWAIFERRCAAYERTNGEWPNLILPVLWKRPLAGDFPAFASKLQFGFNKESIVDDQQRLLAEDYVRHGLLYVMKRIDSTHRQAYDTVVEELAKTVVERAGRHTLDILPAAQRPLDLFEVNPKFPEPAAPWTEGRQVRYARFVIAAASSSEMMTIRTDAAPNYGHRDLDWQPYPPDERSIGDFVQREATDLRLISMWIAADAGVGPAIRKAEEERSAVLVIIDPWSVGLRRLSDALRTFDREQFNNCAVIVVWNRSDEKTVRQRDELLDHLLTILDRRFAVSYPLDMSEGISAASDLEQAIRKTLSELHTQLAMKRAPARVVAGGGPSMIPTISVSSGPA